MKKVVMHTIIAALGLLAIGGTISVLDADFKETAKKGAAIIGKTAASAGVLAACAYPSFAAAMLAGEFAKLKVALYLANLYKSGAIDLDYYRSLLGKDDWGHTECLGYQDYAQAAVTYTTFFLAMSPAMYFVYKLWSSKKKPEATSTPATSIETQK